MGSAAATVTATLYDVFVIGARDPNPVAQMHLASALATHFQAPVAQVAQGIADRNLRAGQALDQAQAQALVQRLAVFGALAELRPAVLARSNASTTASGFTAPPPTGDTMVSSPPSMTRPGPQLGRVQMRDPFNSPTETGPMPLPHQISTGTLRLPHAHGRDPFAPPDDPGSAGSGRIELGRAESSSDDLVQRPSRSLPGASGMSLGRMVADSTESGVELGEDAAKLHSVRCPMHGLYYDKRRASGCRKCMAPAAEAVRSTEAARRPKSLLSLRDDPVRRAFMGLALAVLVGFLPAAYHALKMGAGEVRMLRDEQEQLSKRVGTEEVLRRFDEVEDKVAQARSRAMRNTFVIWVLVSGGTLVGWYRLT